MKKAWVIAVICVAAAGAALAQDQGTPLARGVVVGEATTEPGKTSVVRIDRVSDEKLAGAVGLYLFGTGTVAKDRSQDAVGVFSWQAVGKSADVKDVKKIEALGPALSTTKELEGRTVLEGNTEVLVRGDAASLLRAMARLADQKEEEKKPEGEAPGARDSQGQDSGLIPGGGQSHANNLANPPPLNIKQSPADPQEVVVQDAYGVTSVGCEPAIEVDPATGLGVVKLMEKVTKNGVAEGECLFSGTTADIKRSGIGCDYEVREADKVAVEKDRRFYVVGGRTEFLDQTCTVNEAKTYAIDEVADGCQVVPDAGKVNLIQYTKLQFRGRDNGVVPVADCAQRTGPMFPITYVTEGCELRDDFAGGFSYERVKATYVDEKGNVQSYGACAENGVKYTQYKDSSVCQDFIDFDAKKLYKQYRVRIDLPAGPNFRTHTCEPFENELTGLQETVVGCEAKHTDLFDQGVSRGFKQIVRIDSGASVRGCEEVSDNDYAHQYEINGYIDKDADLKSTPLYQTYINLPAPYGKTIIKPAELKDGTVDIAHVPVGVTSTRDGDVYYIDPTSCSKFTKKEEVQTYQRPNGTTHQAKVQDLPPSGPVDDCQNVIAAHWARTSQSGLQYSYGQIPVEQYGQVGANNSRYYTAAWQGVMNMVRGDGVTISTDTRSYNNTCQGTIGTSSGGPTVGWSCAGQWCYAAGPGSVNWSGSPSCEASLDYNEDEAAVMNSVAQSWGWTGRTYRFE